jgi:hypothetical protein
MDKSDTGVITKSDFEDYINLIMAAVKKVHPTATDSLLTTKEIDLLFKKISNNKEVFTNADFENIYHKKPELLSWIDYFKHNDEDVLYLINKNLKKLLNIQATFFENMKNIMEGVSTGGNDLTAAITEINFFCKEIEKKRKKFLHSGSVFNIRTVFENLTRAFSETKTKTPLIKRDSLNKLNFPVVAEFDIKRNEDNMLEKKEHEDFCKIFLI